MCAVCRGSEGLLSRHFGTRFRRGCWLLVPYLEILSKCELIEMGLLILFFLRRKCLIHFVLCFTSEVFL